MAHYIAKHRLHLLGSPLIETNKRTTQIKLRKAIALVAYLAVENRPFSREYLATLLWPSLGLGSALANLRQILSLLRATFENGCIVVEGDLIQLDHTAIGIDIYEFHELSLRQSSENDLARLEAASNLYRGDFLEGFNLGNCEEFDEWQDAVRERFRLEFGELLETLARGHLQASRPDQALPFARRWLALDQLNESAHRALMEVHRQTGRKDLVHKQFESCARALAQEGFEPDDFTRELYDTIVRSGAKAALVGPANFLKKEKRDRPHRLMRRIALGFAVTVATALIINANPLLAVIFGNDFSVAGLEAISSGDGLTDVRVALKNEGIAQRNVGYSLEFYYDELIGIEFK